MRFGSLLWPLDQSHKSCSDVCSWRQLQVADLEAGNVAVGRRGALGRALLPGVAWRTRQTQEQWSKSVSGAWWISTYTVTVGQVDLAGPGVGSKASI